MLSGNCLAVDLAAFGTDAGEPAIPVVANANVALSNPATITTRTRARRIAATAQNTIEKCASWQLGAEQDATATSATVQTRKQLLLRRMECDITRSSGVVPNSS